jgi:serine/threonine-protein phosphatase PP1 catalytic subunit
VDRGPNSIEVIAYLLALKIKYPNHIWLLRGNHETAEISRDWGFLQEFVDRRMESVFYSFTDTFKWLPIAAIVGHRIFCVHGGISPELRVVTQIRDLKRPLEIPEDGLLADLLWADPSMDGDGWQANNRGTSVSYGPDVVDEFLKRHHFDVLVRAHERAQEGFHFPFPGRQNCVTLFSAPNYEQFMNAAAIMRVEEDMTCGFEIIEPISPDDD